MKLVSFDYKTTLSRMSKLIIRYQVIVSFILLSALIGAAFWRINNVTVPEVDQEKVDNEIVNLRSVQFNQDAIDQIESLRDSNVNINPDFKDDRNNPFAE